ncbi:MAG: DeoR/GlpR transcriptional regulator, partial [Sphingobacteriales bacterium]
MSQQERKRIILEIVAKKVSISVKELAEQLAISEITIRRDLQLLAKQGFLERTHGGAMKIEKQALHHFEHKSDSKQVEKEHIAALAAQFIEPNDTIFLDCGSTVFALCKHLKNIPRLKIITNSLPILVELLGYKNLEINLIGGEVDTERMAVHGSIALEHIGRYYAQKSFIGVDGISLKNGLTAHSEKEAEMAKALAKQAKTTFLLCDSSKVEKESYLKFAPLSMIEYLITDKKFDEKLKKDYEKCG